MKFCAKEVLLTIYIVSTGQAIRWDCYINKFVGILFIKIIIQIGKST